MARVRTRRGATWAAIAIAIVLAACGDSGVDEPAGGPAPSTCASTVDERLRSTADDDGREAVVSVDLPLVDRSRPTRANGDQPRRDERAVPTRLYLPAERSAPLPLFVWAHGLGGDGAAYDGLVCPVAAAGYAVAAPTFPLSNGAAPGGQTFDAYLDQPADVSFVIDEVLSRYGPAGTARAGVLDGERIGAGGHSLGAITTEGLVANTCCADPRLKAAVEVDGSPRPYPGGRVQARGVPTLVVHGEEDDLFPLEEGRAVYDRAEAPKAFLVLEGAGHNPFGPGEIDVVVDATIAWLGAHLRGDLTDAELRARLESFEATRLLTADR